MANKVIFSGTTREIIVKPGVTEIDVKIDLYSDWKEWSLLEDNAKFLPAFRTFGGDETITGQFAPSYFFLINQWQVVVDNNQDVTFGVNLYSEDFDTAFIVGSGSSVSNRTSDAVIVDKGIAETLDYGEHVQINSFVGTTGTTYPLGTAALPVNNISDALIILNERKLHELHIFGPINFDVDLNDSFEVYGGNIRDVATFQNIELSGSTFRQCVLGGSFKGSAAFDNCLLEDGMRIIPNGVSNIFMQHTGLQGKLHIADGSIITMADCFSQIPGNDSPEIFVGNDVSLNIRRYSGGMAFYDIKSGSTITIEYAAGNCKILSGCTGGQIEIRGISKLTDQSSGTTVGTDGLLIPVQLAQQHSLNVNTEITKNK